MLLALPQTLEQVLTRLETGQHEVERARNGSRRWPGLHGYNNGEASSVSGFTLSFLFATSLTGGIFLLSTMHQLTAAWLCFALAG